MNEKKDLKRSGLLFGAVSVLAGGIVADPNSGREDDHSKIEMDPNVRMVEHDSSLFGANPDFGDTWDIRDQEETYAKSPITTQRPLLELGRPLYSEGPLKEGQPFIFGPGSEFSPHLMVYGDWRTAAGFNSGLPDGNGGSLDFGQVATRLNLDIDFKLTATERIHAFVQPFEQPGQLTRAQFGDLDESDFEFDLNLDALFFEGDLGAMLGGKDGAVSDFDLPIAFGLMPLLFQNGVWVQDAFTGLAVTIPAKNSGKFGISNYDITVFAGFDNVNSGAVIDAGGKDSDATIFGATAFVEAMQGYWEFGYGLTLGEDNAEDADYHNLTAAFSKRYGAWLSNSVRLILNVGQDADVDTARGALLLIENSFITSKPYTVVPYVNLFAGFGTPQPLARQVGGVLNNTGVNFEADVLTGFSSMTPFGHDVIGAAAGVNLLFNLDQQLVVEIAGQFDHGDDSKTNLGLGGNEIGFGVRWQKPISHRWILRADAFYGIFEELDDDITGLRFEFRWKF